MPAKARLGGTQRARHFALLSVRYSSNESSKLSTSALVNAASGATSIAIASAFYDKEWLRELLSALPRSVRAVRLLFNGLGGARLESQQTELASLATSLTRVTTRVEVRLAFVPGIFHSKLFLIEGPTGTTAFVGSANATRVAMSVNEELLVRIVDDGAFEAYFARVWAESAPLHQLTHRLKANSLVRFFRSGSLYFKPSAAMQLTLNPFTELFAALPEHERRKLTDFRSEFADSDPGIGPFNLSKAARLKAPAHTEQEKGSVSIKPHSVETYFGYWVPHAEEAKLKRRIDKAAEHKRERWTAVLASLRQMGTAGMERSYSHYLGDVREHLERHGVPYRKVLSRTRDPFVVERGTAFFSRAIDALANPSFMDRLCRPFVSGAMPEIWEDQASYAEFRGTFFEHLAFVNTGERRRSRVPSTILTRIGAVSGATPSDLEHSLELYLRTDGWAPDDW